MSKMSRWTASFFWLDPAYSFDVLLTTVPVVNTQGVLMRFALAPGSDESSGEVVVSLIVNGMMNEKKSLTDKNLIDRAFNGIVV